MQVPGDYFTYTFDPKFRMTVNGPTTVSFKRMRSDGAEAPPEEIVFSEDGTKEYENYYGVGKPRDTGLGRDYKSKQTFYKI